MLNSVWRKVRSKRTARDVGVRLYLSHLADSWLCRLNDWMSNWHGRVLADPAVSPVRHGLVPSTLHGWKRSWHSVGASRDSPSLFSEVVTDQIVSELSCEKIWDVFYGIRYFNESPSSLCRLLWIWRIRNYTCIRKRLSLPGQITWYRYFARNLFGAFRKR